MFEFFSGAIFLNEISCIQLEMTENSLLGKISKVIDVDGNLIVLSDNDILVFDKENGSFLHRIGNIGEGSQEY